MAGARTGNVVVLDVGRWGGELPSSYVTAAHYTSYTQAKFFYYYSVSGASRHGPSRAHVVLVVTQNRNASHFGNHRTQNITTTTVSQRRRVRARTAAVEGSSRTAGDLG